MLIAEESAWRRSLPTAYQLRRMFGVVTARSGSTRTNLDKHDIEERIDMVTLYEHLHPDFPAPRRRSGRFVQAKCWRHQDNMPSLSLDTMKKRSRCFSCSERASAFDMISEAEGLTFWQSLLWANERF